jgi:uncharacterized protein (DUF169 family)
MTYEQQAKELESYIRPDAFPMAVRVLKPGEEPPAKARQPLRDLKVRISICQAMGMARRYGWTIALGPEDQSCPIAQVAVGFGPALPFYTEGNLACGMYAETMEGGARAEAAIPKFKPGEAAWIVIGPLAKATFNPDALIVYANSAQIMRLVAGAVYKKGGSLPAVAAPRADCADLIVGTLRENTAQVILPCYGDRVFGLTQDHEMCFAMPYSQMDDLLKGLAGTEKGGVRYPIPANLRTEADFPPKYKQLAEMWKTGKK